MSIVKKNNYYYDKNGRMNDDKFKERLATIHNEIEQGVDNLNDLLKIRRKLYALKYKYEESGCYYLDCEAELIALNEIIEETREGEK